MSTEADRRLTGLFLDGPNGIGLFDPQERLQRANSVFLCAFASTLDASPTWESLMRACHRRGEGLSICTDNIDHWLRRVRRSHRQVPVRSFESDLTDGRWMWVTETMDAQGWLLVTMVDITALKASEITLRHAHQQALLASLTDGLTGLHNRRHIFERLDTLLATARDMRFPLNVAVLDLDHFKRINDVHGHAVGDAVLRHFAAEVRAQLRPLDLVGRIGGEEFMLLLPNVPLDGARLALERLRTRIGNATPVADVAQLAYTFSAGLTGVTAGDDATRVFGRADRALYLAKHGGRDQTVVLDGTAPLPPS